MVLKCLIFLNFHFIKCNLQKRTATCTNLFATCLQVFFGTLLQRKFSFLSQLSLFLLKIIEKIQYVQQQVSMYIVTLKTAQCSLLDVTSRYWCWELMNSLLIKMHEFWQARINLLWKREFWVLTEHWLIWKVRKKAKAVLHLIRRSCGM